MLGRPQGFSVDMDAVWLAILVEPWWNRNGGTRKIDLPVFYGEKTGLAVSSYCRFVISHVNVLPSRLSERTSDDWIKRVITGDGNKQTK
jgi:hypothetical protein